ncbi:restriction endonuclease [Undibacterium curvum]|uniref:restriction endonuclease n=1 Tax=Undibacterium curvum TaxID=2762294 RepID=UPI003D09B0DB
MSFIEISKEEFDSLNIARIGFLPERAWFRSTELNIAGTIIIDQIDKDWSYVLLSKDEDGIYRYINGESSFANRKDAEKKLHDAAIQIELSETFKEELYTEADSDSTEKQGPIVATIDDEIKKYFKKHPEKLYELSPRKFEELVASILKDLGFDVELTQATRDGGRDIIAYVRNSVCSYLTHIECKRYAADNKVGVGIIREVLGVHNIRKATKSVIVTTSFFSSDAVKEAEMLENQIDLRDFNDLKSWLQRY